MASGWLRERGKAEREEKASFLFFDTTVLYTHTYTTSNYRPPGETRLQNRTVGTSPYITFQLSTYTVHMAKHILSHPAALILDCTISLRALALLTYRHPQSGSGAPFLNLCREIQAERKRYEVRGVTLSEAAARLLCPPPKFRC